MLFADKTYAAAGQLNTVSDTITTSRPSASAPLSTLQSASASNVSIIDNGSIFLASDAAKIIPAGTNTLSSGITIASMSALAAGTRTVFFTGTVAALHDATDILAAPITAMHKIQFTTQNAIPALGKIVITFPGSANNTASPSATTFAFNGLATAQVQLYAASSPTYSCTVSAPTVTCSLTGASTIGASVPVTIYVGCTALSGANCSASVPTLINPTISATCTDAASCNANVWTVALATQNSSSVDVDTGTAKVGTINSVRVYATVDETLSFTIAGVAHGVAMNTGNTTGCTNVENTNSGIGSTATSVNLGALSSGSINISAQLITISTNALSGYTLTATTSGHLINPTNGIWIPDNNGGSTVFFTVGSKQFGLHPCGLDVSGATWGTGATGGGANAKYGWPTTGTPLTIASDSTGPVWNNSNGNGLTSVEYAATVDGSIPAGDYASTITYVATPSF